MLTRLVRTTTLLLAIVLALAAVTLTGLRLWAPSLARYQGEIEAAATGVLGVPVRVGRIEASWRGLEPLLVLSDIGLRDPAPGVSAPAIGELRLRPDLLHLLLHRELRLASIELVGVTVRLVRAADGSVQLDGLPVDPAWLADGGGLTERLRRLSLHRSAISFIDYMHDGVTRRLTDVTLVLTQRIAYLQLYARARLPEEFGRRIELAGRLHGALDDPFGWSGRLYLRGEALALEALRAQLEASELPLLRGVADVRCWIDLLVGEPVAWVGEIDLNDADIGAAPAWHAARLGAQFGWRRIDNGWQAAVQEVRIQRDAASHAGPRLVLRADRVPDGEQLTGAVGRLQLEELGALAAALGDAGGDIGRQLAALRPRGMLRSLQFSLLRGAHETRAQGFDASFSALGIGPYDHWPSLDGLDGRISGTPAAGTVRVETAALRVADDRLFRAPLQFDAFDAAVDWQRGTSGLELVMPVLHLRNADLAAGGNAGLVLPDEKGAPRLDLQLAIEHFAVARTGAYLPAGRMSPTGVAWLDRSLAGGTVTDGTVLISGPVDKLPFDHGEGRLEVRLPVSDATLDFKPGWTPVTELDAQVDFTGRGMDIRSRRGHIRSADLHDVSAVIPDLQHPHLTIRGDVTGALPVMLAELAESPLGESYGGFVDRIRTRGNTRLGLDIDIPLVHDQLPLTVRGRIGLQGDRLQLRDSDLLLENIRGELTFDEHGLAGEGLSASLFDTPVSARVRTDAGDAVTYVTLEGVLPLPDRVLPPDSPLRERISGASDWRVELMAHGQPRRGRPADLDLRVSSTLAGTAIDLPEPLGKRAVQERELAVLLRGIENPVQVIEVGYGDAIKADLRVVREGEALQLQRGVVALGGVEPLLPDHQLLLVMGRLARFSLAEWQPLLGQEGGRAAMPVRLSLRLGSLELPGHRMRDVGIELQNSGRDYTVRSVGDGAEGDLRFTQGEHGIESVVADMQHLALEQDAQPTGEQARHWSADSFPRLEFRTRKLLYDGTDFGALELQVDKPEPGVARVERLALSSELLDLNLTGEWRDVAGDSRTRIDAVVNDGSAGRLLEAFGYQQVIEDGQLNGELHAGWAGSPWEIELQKLQGDLQLTIKEGQLLEVEPGAGRVLGLASIAALPRRLRLDFSDLFGKGFGFSRIGGHFILDSGNAWSNDLEIDGPAARIDITGRVGLARRDYDQQVTVTPYLNSSLPLAGVLAGGPAVGAAVLVADKLLEGKLGLNELARRKYTVTGSWDDPQVSVMDTSPVQDDEVADQAEREGFFE